MARVLRIPNHWELPESPRREFVEALFKYYGEGGRPALRTITDEIAEHVDACTASRETIRRMLRGLTVPMHWDTAEAVLTVLWLRAKIDPDSPAWAPGGWDDPPTHREWTRSLWNKALDHDHDGMLRERARRAAAYPDEPPF